MKFRKLILMTGVVVGLFGLPRGQGEKQVVIVSNDDLHHEFSLEDEKVVAYAELERLLDDEETNITSCPESLCPLILRANGICNARCNNDLCESDFGDCSNDGTVPPNSGDEFQSLARKVFYSVMGIGVAVVVYSVLRGICTTRTRCLDMSPWDRFMICIGRKTREDVTGEPEDSPDDADETEPGLVPIAPVVSVAQELRSVNRRTQGGAAGNQDQDDHNDGEHGEDFDDGDYLDEGLPTANRASVDSGALPTAADITFNDVAREASNGNHDITSRLRAELLDGAGRRANDIVLNPEDTH